MVWPMLLPVFLRVFAPEMAALRGDDLWALYLFAVPLFATWVCLVVVPFVRPRRLILNERGVTLDTLWRRQHWAWNAVAGIWPLGGYKCFLDVVPDHGRPKRIFLGPYWPGGSAGMARQLTRYRTLFLS